MNKEQKEWRMADLQDFILSEGWKLERPDKDNPTAVSARDMARNERITKEAHDWLRGDGVRHKARRDAIIAEAFERLRGNVVTKDTEMVRVTRMSDAEREIVNGLSPRERLRRLVGDSTK